MAHEIDGWVKDRGKEWARRKDQATRRAFLELLKLPIAGSVTAEGGSSAVQSGVEESGVDTGRDEGKGKAKDVGGAGIAAQNDDDDDDEVQGALSAKDPGDTSGVAETGDDAVETEEKEVWDAKDPSRRLKAQVVIPRPRPPGARMEAKSPRKVCLNSSLSYFLIFFSLLGAGQR